MGRSVSNSSSCAADKSSPKMHEDDIMSMISGMQSPAMNERILFLSGDVNEHTIPAIIAQLISFANQNMQQPIYLIISTYGGSIDEMFSLYDTIKFLPCPVYTIALGKVMSAGVLLLASGVKGRRLIGRNARIMMHPVASETGGNVFQMVNSVKETERLQNIAVDALSKETNMSIDQIKNIMSLGYDYFMTSEEAIKLGIVDKVIGD